MKVLTLLLMLLAVMPFQEEEVIPWSAGERLDWGDFKGVPDPSADAAATTVSALSYTFNGYLDGKRLVYEYQVQALFFPEKSWVRQEQKDDELLLHEQLHFDITALYAIRLRRAFDTIAPSSDPVSAVKAVYDWVRRELDSVQERYDRETDFSRNLQEQLLWESRIRVYLENAYE